MSSATLFSSVSQNQNAAGPAGPANTTANLGGLVTRLAYTLTVTPSSGWAEASIAAGPDNSAFPFAESMYCAPGAGSTTHTARYHGAALSPASGGNDGVRYVKATAMTVSPGATAMLTVAY